jgi:hypothetical protein
MATATITPVMSSISNIIGYCAYAEVKYGSNGAAGGVPEYGVGHDPSDTVTGRRVWDGNLADGLESGWINVELALEPGGGANDVKWTVFGGTPNPVFYSGVTYGTIVQVRVRAAVQAPVQMQWRSVTVKFYKNGTMVDSFTRRAGPEVDRRSYPTPVAAEQVLTVVPAAADNDKVVVTGQVRLHAPAGISLQATDLFGQVFVDTNACTIV